MGTTSLQKVKSATVGLEGKRVVLLCDSQEAAALPLAQCVDGSWSRDSCHTLANLHVYSSFY